MKMFIERWHQIRGEKFLRLVFFRGFFQFGFLAAGFFIFISALGGDAQFTAHAYRSLIGFPIVGLFFGAALWLTNRVLYREQPGSRSKWPGSNKN